MLPITNHLSCTDPLDDFESLSYHQAFHAKSYITGLAAGGSKTCKGIAREVLPAKSERELNTFLTEYDWNERKLNHDRLEELQNHGEMCWSQDGYMSLDWDNIETPASVFDRLVPSPAGDPDDPLSAEVSTNE